MPFKDLETQSLADYIAAERKRAGDFWLFMHIPKTAGSSFSVEMAARLYPYKNIHIDHSTSDLPYAAKLALEVDGFVASYKAKPYASASGHLPYEQVDKIKMAVPQTRLMTFLRAPEARVVSDYRYQRTPMHPPYQKFIAQYPTLQSYVEAKHEHNKMARFIMGNLKDVTEEKLIAHAGANFAFIGLLEMYPMSFGLAFTLMGQPGLLPKEHQRKTPDTKDTEVQITPELRQMIRQSNTLDQALYDYTRTVLLQRRDEWSVLRKASGGGQG